MFKLLNWVGMAEWYCCYGHLKLKGIYHAFKKTILSARVQVDQIIYIKMNDILENPIS